MSNHIAYNYPQRFFFKHFSLAQRFDEFYSVYSPNLIAKYLKIYVSPLKIPPGCVVRPYDMESRFHLTNKSKQHEFHEFCQEIQTLYGSALKYLSTINYAYLLDLAELLDILSHIYYRSKFASMIPVHMKLVVFLFFAIRHAIYTHIDAQSLPSVHRFVMNASPSDLLYRFQAHFEELFAAPAPRLGGIYIELVRELRLISVLDEAANLDDVYRQQMAGTVIWEVTQNLRILVEERIGINLLDFEELVLLLDEWVTTPFFKEAAAVGYSTILGSIKSQTDDILKSCIKGSLKISAVIDVLNLWVELLGTTNGTDYMKMAKIAHLRLPTTGFKHMTELFVPMEQPAPPSTVQRSYGFDTRDSQYCYGQPEMVYNRNSISALPEMCFDKPGFKVSAPKTDYKKPNPKSDWRHEDRRYSGTRSREHDDRSRSRSPGA